MKEAIHHRIGSGKDRPIHASAGFSLLESVVSMAIFLVVFGAGLEFFGRGRQDYSRLKEEEETDCTAFAAVDRIRADLRAAGFGLGKPMHWGLVEAVAVKDKELHIYIKECGLKLLDSVEEGSRRILLESVKDISEGREIVICDEEKGERHSVDSLDADGINLNLPVRSTFSMQDTSVLLLRKVTLFLDSSSRILRRRINDGSAQPLAEGIASFDFVIQTGAPADISLTTTAEENKRYEFSVYPKNPALID